MDKGIIIERYDGPACRRTDVTHQITVTPLLRTGKPHLDFMEPGTCFRYEGGPCLEIVVAVRDIRKHESDDEPVRTHDLFHVYLAKEVTI